ncbi:sodium/glutamate symporter [Sphingobacterium sp. SG20118]|uniref:sodium/glutamate symporter n=1 Tax=Sphingobacterium sp. SG20118 TaxID=3367156 RepID=UPI0037DFC4DF
MTFGIFETLAFACLVLLLGFFIVKRVRFFRNYNIPEPVVGGFFIAVVLYILNSTMGLSFKFEGSLQTAMMLIFFTSIGLSAEFEKLKKGGKPLLIFVLLTGTFMLVQNIFGISIASLLGINPSYGLIAGSITLTGGHGNWCSMGAKSNGYIPHKWRHGASYGLCYVRLSDGRPNRWPSCKSAAEKEKYKTSQ